MDKNDMKNFKLASLDEKAINEFKNLEEKLKMETGKEFALVAWEKIK